jgi:hypothetical protein
MPGYRDQLAALLLSVAPACALAQAPGQTFVLTDGDLQKRANGVLALMGYMVTPDVTTGSLGISNNATGNPDFRMTTMGGGFTLQDRPLYLEGTLGLARYDPTFVSSNGQVERSVASQWEAQSASGGIGWDFPLAPRLVARPIANASYGRVRSDVSLRETGSGQEIEFLAGGKLEAYGLGGSVVLDYTDYRPQREIDVELRYTNIRLQSAGGSSAAVRGSAGAESVSFWSRRRAPSGLSLLERPLRHVLELAYSRFFGDLDGVLGFNDIVSLGAGLELDASARDGAISRARLMARYKIGENVTGWSIGLAVSF